MCIVCIQFDLGKLTRFEAQTALMELVLTEAIDEKHAEEVYDKLQDFEIP